MIIVVDCDGVLLNWEHTFRYWMKTKGYKAKYVSYNVSEMYEISETEALRQISYFSESAAIGFLPPLRDSIKYVRKLHEEHGYVFHCITSFGNDQYAMRLREENLKRVFGESVFERIVCLGCGEDKTEALKRYNDSGFVWIEDKPENAEVGLQLGLRPFLINHNYNEKAELSNGIVRVNNWKEIYEHIA